MQELRLPVGANELRKYFASVSAKHPEDPHWQNGIEMCNRWLQLSSLLSATQVDIDLFVKRLAEEKNPGSGWLDLRMQFKHWARSHGFRQGGLHD